VLCHPPVRHDQFALPIRALYLQLGHEFIKEGAYFVHFASAGVATERAVSLLVEVARAENFVTVGALVGVYH
jgi:hypothetical protein